MTTKQAGYIIAETLRSAVLEKLENEKIASKELEVLIYEIGQLVAEQQRAQLAAVHKAEKRMALMVTDVKKAIEEFMENNCTTVVNNVSNVTISPEDYQKALANMLFDQVFGALGQKK